MKKIIVIGIIILFVGMVFQPAFANIIMENNPPYEPRDPIPPDGATNVSGCSVIWTGGDPDGDNVTYDVYHDNSNPPKQVGWNQSETYYTCGDCEYNTTYYWTIIAWDEHGASTLGPNWAFTTEQNYPPNPAEDPHPVDGDPRVPCEGLILKWNGSDPNIGDKLRYDLYFDDVNPPLTQQLRESSKEYWEIPFTLTKYKTYYWRVDTYDKSDEFTEGYIWSFSTGDWPLTDPIIDGPTHGVKNQEYEFTFVSVNPDNDSMIKYHVRWGDGTENLTEFYLSGEVVTLSHSWSYDGEKVILARAIDEYGANSDWSTWKIVIPRDKQEDCDCQTAVNDVDLNRVDKALYRLEAFNNELSVVSKQNPLVEKIYQQLTNKFLILKGIIIDNNLNQEFPLICAILGSLYLIYTILDIIIWYLPIDYDLLLMEVIFFQWELGIVFNCSWYEPGPPHLSKMSNKIQQIVLGI